MKKIYMIAAIVAGAGILLTGCQSENKSINKAETTKMDNTWNQSEKEDEPLLVESKSDEIGYGEKGISGQDEINDGIASDEESLNKANAETWEQLDDNHFQFINGKLHQIDTNGNWIESGNVQNNAADEEIYRSFISQRFSETENIRIALADLTHDEHEEMIVFWNEDEPNYLLHVDIYTIEQNQVKEIFNKIPFNYRYELYLSIKNGKACLFERADGVYQGEGDLAYTLFDFNSDYTENILDTYSIHIMSDTQQGNMDYDLFAKKTDAFAEKSILITQASTTELWPVNNVLKNDKAIYDDSYNVSSETSVREYSEPLIKEVSEQDRKIQHIRNVFNEINAKKDLFVLHEEHYDDFADNGNLVKAVLRNDYNLIANDVQIPLVEYYYENNQVIFAHAVNGENEYRYYFENGNLIREVGSDGRAIDYPDGDGFKKTADPKAGQIHGRGVWEAALFAEDFWGMGD